MAARFAYSWQATEDDIARLCAYITDDSTVAAYHGTTRERVAKVRAKMAKRLLRLVDPPQDEHHHVSFNMAKTEQEARDGSAQLLERCNMLFRKYGKKQGIPWGDALVVQQFGWAVLNRLRASQA